MRVYRKILPEDFDVAKLWLATKEGRLFEIPNKADRNQVRKDILLYVERIRPFVTPHFLPYIDDLWEQILACDEFAAYVSPTPRAQKCRLFNKYSVIRIIGVLRDAGVYEQHVDAKYLSQLEQTDKDNAYRCFLGKGIKDHKKIKKLQQMVASLPINII
jgi:hypothetical protein